MLPPRFVLSRGWGSSLERATVFSEVADLLGIESCMVAVPFGSQDQRGVRYWIPGALIDGQIYLFDSRMGRPIPGPDGRGWPRSPPRGALQPAIPLRSLIGEAGIYDVNAD